MTCGGAGRPAPLAGGARRADTFRDRVTACGAAEPIRLRRPPFIRRSFSRSDAGKHDCDTNEGAITMAETRQECIVRWEDNLKCLDEEIDRLGSERVKAGPSEYLDKQIAQLKVEREEIAEVVKESQGADDVLWGTLRRLVNAMFDKLTPTLGGKGSSFSANERH